MIEDAADECLCIIDCSGLHEIASTNSDNLKSLYLDRLSKGVIGVPICVWQEFRDLYEDEAASLELHVAHKIKMKKQYYVGAARIADKINSSLSKGPYDNQSDLYAASICSIEKYTLLTTQSQLADYKQMDCCEVSDLVTWANGGGTEPKSSKK
jgi:hypothetical protein